MAFYADYGIHAYRPRISNYILRFATHFDQYVNSFLVRTVDYRDVVWC
jgi:hypothetical protein